ncbi:MAG TPA: hypothetical protein PLU95_01470 [Syntrophales bacterium]|nr:hypothetical protein [Syntrophales bacterium]HOH72300.1 hypothetical protein [Syntrophales bacterium]HPJ96570.1 hypothetical protein [Syntrophales bacterium]HPN07944.1 hypothetical protein [Syntrophales bacterium]HPX82088.1 hypothetical protein [Syntrophales bacterium]
MSQFNCLSHFLGGPAGRHESINPIFFAESCVVPQNNTIPDGKIVVVVPFNIMGDVLPKHKEFWTYGKQLYIDLAAEYADNFEKLPD